MKHSICLLAAAVVVSACVSTMESVGKRLDASEPHHLYEGERKSAIDLAQVMVVGQIGASIEFIDGVDRRKAVGVDKAFVYLTPGPHRLQVQYSLGGTFTSGQYTQLVELQVSLQASHSYALHYTHVDETKQSLRFRLVDYGISVPRRCVLLGIHNGGPTFPPVRSCIMGDGAGLSVR